MSFASSVLFITTSILLLLGSRHEWRNDQQSGEYKYDADDNWAKPCAEEIHAIKYGNRAAEQKCCTNPYRMRVPRTHLQNTNNNKNDWPPTKQYSNVDKPHKQVDQNNTPKQYNDRTSDDLQQTIIHARSIRLTGCHTKYKANAISDDSRKNHD